MQQDETRAGCERTEHGDHTHTHAEGCGHEATRHEDHMDYMHDGHRHAQHESHWDEH